MNCLGKPWLGRRTGWYSQERGKDVTKTRRSKQRSIMARTTPQGGQCFQAICTEWRTATKAEKVGAKMFFGAELKSLGFILKAMETIQGFSEGEWHDSESP